MSRICDFCGKGPLTGNYVSHATNRIKRKFLPNLQKIRIKDNGDTLKVVVCTRCIKKPKFQRV